MVQRSIKETIHEKSAVNLRAVKFFAITFLFKIGRHLNWIRKNLLDVVVAGQDLQDQQFLQNKTRLIKDPKCLVKLVGLVFSKASLKSLLFS